MKVKKIMGLSKHLVRCVHMAHVRVNIPQNFQLVPLKNIAKQRRGLCFRHSFCFLLLICFLFLFFVFCFCYFAFVFVFVFVLALSQNFLTWHLQEDQAVVEEALVWKAEEQPRGGFRFWKDITYVSLQPLAAGPSCTFGPKMAGILARHNNVIFSFWISQ